MTRRRSEYLLSPLSDTPPPRAPVSSPSTVRPVDAADRDQLATMILAAYRGTIDDEGEDHAAALDAVDDWLARRVPAHSFVLEQAGEIAALSFVVIVAGATTSTRSRRPRRTSATASAARRSRRRCARCTPPASRMSAP